MLGPAYGPISSSGLAVAHSHTSARDGVRGLIQAGKNGIRVARSGHDEYVQVGYECSGESASELGCGSEREVVLVLALCVLAEPEQDGGKHDAGVLDDICNAVVLVALGQCRNEILDRQHGDATSETAGHESEADEEEQAGSPLYAVGRKRAATSTAERESGADVRKMLLVDEVDDDHAERAAQAGHPVGKGDVGGWWIVGRGGVDGFAQTHGRDDGGVEEEPPSQGEERAGEVDARLALAHWDWQLAQMDGGWWIEAGGWLNRMQVRELSRGRGRVEELHALANVRSRGGP
ncbi:hypothetical protein L1887_42343 [Cichorium endivia]|nr:hypothetical protein L1887_42343 [Cichorium endivia]